MYKRTAQDEAQRGPFKERRASACCSTKKADKATTDTPVVDKAAGVAQTTGKTHDNTSLEVRDSASLEAKNSNEKREKIMAQEGEAESTPNAAPKTYRYALGDHQKLPDSPGVYLMQDARDQVIYVGKALSPQGSRRFLLLLPN